VIYAITPFLTAIIGWVTNWVAVKMLFVPLTPKVIFGIRFQGLIPRRQKELAEQCAEIVEKELFQQKLIREAVESANVGDLAEQKVRLLMKEKLMDKLKGIPMLGAFITAESMGGIEEFVIKEIREMSEDLALDFADQIEGQLQVRHIVQSRVESFDLERLKEIVETVAAKEFKTIEWVGAFLGFCVGLVQSLVLYFSH
jgi:uncharacterized membrane protein YheB (UPF0754 family)